MGNYHSHEYKKFVPELQFNIFKQILQSNPLYTDSEDSLYKEVIDELYPQVEAEVFKYMDPYITLNFPDQKGVTGYYSSNIKKDDLDLIHEFLN